MKKEYKTIYLCDCGKKQLREEMTREYDFGHEQLCCVKCSDVLIDALHEITHCKVCENCIHFEKFNKQHNTLETCGIYKSKKDY